MPDEFKGLFYDAGAIEAAQRADELALLKSVLKARSHTVDITVLNETFELVKDDKKFYTEILDQLTETTVACYGSPHLIAVHILVHPELPVSSYLLEQYKKFWEQVCKTGRGVNVITLNLLSLAALSDSIDDYIHILNAIMKEWRAGVIKLSGPRLLQVFLACRWLLSPESRASGDGYILSQWLRSRKTELMPKNERNV